MVQDDSKTGTVDAPLRTAYRGPNGLSQPVDLRIWPSSSPPKVAIILVFIPGNPGLVDYYLDFLGSIHKRLGPSAVVYAVGHLGHSSEYGISAKDAMYPLSKGWGGKPAPSLEDQIRHKIDFVDYLRTQVPEETKVVLISHSVGSYIASKVMDARPDAVQHAYCLFPTISHILLTPNGRRLWFLWFRFAPIVGFLLCSLLLFLPAFLLHAIVAFVTRQREPASRVTTSLVASPAAVAAALAMSLDEMRDIKDLDRTFISRHRDRLTFYWSEGERDHWVPDERVQEIVAALADSKAVKEDRIAWYRCDEGMPHAFCIGTSPFLLLSSGLLRLTSCVLDHSLQMAAKCSRWIYDDWLS